MTIGEAVDYVIKTMMSCKTLFSISCKICMVLQGSCKTGILIYYLARFVLSCKTLARLASAYKKLARIPCFVRNLQDKCKISISSKLGASLRFRHFLLQKAPTANVDFDEDRVYSGYFENSIASIFNQKKTCNHLFVNDFKLFTVKFLTVRVKFSSIS